MHAELAPSPISYTAERREESKAAALPCEFTADHPVRSARATRIPRPRSRVTPTRSGRTDCVLPIDHLGFGVERNHYHHRPENLLCATRIEFVAPERMVGA